MKLRVLSSFDDPESTPRGTLITYEEDETMETAIISGIAFSRDEACSSEQAGREEIGEAHAAR